MLLRQSGQMLKVASPPRVYQSSYFVLDLLRGQGAGVAGLGVTGRETVSRRTSAGLLDDGDMGEFRRSFLAWGRPSVWEWRDWRPGRFSAGLRRDLVGAGFSSGHSTIGDRG